MPWFFAAFFLSIAFVVWALIMAGTVAILQFIGLPYILTLPIAAITPLILIFFVIVGSDMFLANDRRSYED